MHHKGAQVKPDVSDCQAFALKVKTGILSSSDSWI
jgi:hypothetical protein